MRAAPSGPHNGRRGPADLQRQVKTGQLWLPWSNMAEAVGELYL